MVYPLRNKSVSSVCRIISFQKTLTGVGEDDMIAGKECQFRTWRSLGLNASQPPFTSGVALAKIQSPQALVSSLCEQTTDTKTADHLQIREIIYVKHICSILFSTKQTFNKQ